VRPLGKSAAHFRFAGHIRWIGALALVCAGLNGCGTPLHYREDQKLLLVVPATQTQEGLNIEQSVQFVLPKGTYACSFCLRPPAQNTLRGSLPVELSYKVTFSESVSTTHSASRKLNLNAESISDVLGETQRNIEIARDQDDTVLPFPWTHLADDPGAVNCAIWEVHPPFRVPDDGLCGQIQFRIQFQTEIPEDVGIWTFRVERFLDAI